MVVVELPPDDEVFVVFEVVLPDVGNAVLLVTVFVAAGVLFCIQKYAPMPMITRSMTIATAQPEPPSPLSVLFPGVLIIVVMM